MLLAVLSLIAKHELHPVTALLHLIEAEARSNKRLGANTSEDEPTKYGHYRATGFLGRASTKFPA